MKRCLWMALLILIFGAKGQTGALVSSNVCAGTTNSASQFCVGYQQAQYTS